jgi:hypothetical protein
MRNSRCTPNKSNRPVSAICARRVGAARPFCARQITAPPGRNGNARGRIPTPCGVRENLFVNLKIRVIMPARSAPFRRERQPGSVAGGISRLTSELAGARGFTSPFIIWLKTFQTHSRVGRSAAGKIALNFRLPNFSEPAPPFSSVAICLECSRDVYSRDVYS